MLGNTVKSFRLLPNHQIMKSSKGDREEEEEEYEEFCARKDAPVSSSSKDGKNGDKANATRSKHSVTEQRRRSKINERFQILRDLIPNSDQKRDTASFLLEVIEYVQYLQEKLQKYEGSYQGWRTEPTKLMPWRNSHWRVPSFVGNPLAIKSDSGPVSAFPMRFDENSATIPTTMQANSQNSVESDPGEEGPCKVMDLQSELANKTMVVPMSLLGNLPAPVRQGDGTVPSTSLQGIPTQSTECSPIASGTCQQEELAIEGGTIRISSVYSQGLLNSLTHALQSAGVDLSRATISVQVDLGKRAARGLPSDSSIAEDHENSQSKHHKTVGHFENATNGDNSDQAQKRMKI